MRILIATHHSSAVGGTETYLRAVIPLLLERGHPVAVLTEMDPDGGLEPVVPPGSGAVRIEAHGESVARTLEHAAGFGPDVVFQQGLADVGLEAGLLRWPSVLFLHSYYGACVSGNKRFVRPQFECCERRLGPACLALYLARGCGGRNPIRMVQEYQLQQRRRRLMASYGAVLVASEAMKSQYEREGLAADRIEKVTLFPTNGAALETAPAPRPFNGRVAFVGRVTAVKGAAHLIPAIGRAQDLLGRALTLLIIGQGPELAHVLDEARRCHVTVEAPGWCAPVRRDALLRNADVLLLPSLWPEPLGLVGVEAGALGVPTVAYDVGGVSDWLVGGRTGEFAKPGSLVPERLGEALASVLEQPERHHALRTGAWQEATGRSPRAHVAALVRCFERVLHGRMA